MFCQQRPKPKDSLWTYNDNFKTHLSLTFNDTVLKEALAEDIRLLYVALTRAIYKIWVGVSVLSNNKVNPLGSLLGLTDKQWTWPDINNALQYLQQSEPEIEIIHAPEPSQLPQLEHLVQQETQQARVLTHPVPRTWRMTSYSELVKPLTHHQSSRDRYFRSMDTAEPRKQVFLFLLSTRRRCWSILTSLI